MVQSNGDWTESVTNLLYKIVVTVLVVGGKVLVEGPTGQGYKMVRRNWHRSLDVMLASLNAFNPQTVGDHQKALTWQPEFNNITDGDGNVVAKEPNPYWKSISAAGRTRTTWATR